MLHMSVMTCTHIGEGEEAYSLLHLLHHTSWQLNLEKMSKLKISIQSKINKTHISLNLKKKKKKKINRSIGIAWVLLNFLFFTSCFLATKH